MEFFQETPIDIVNDYDEDAFLASLQAQYEPVLTEKLHQPQETESKRVEIPKEVKSAFPKYTNTAEYRFSRLFSEYNKLNHYQLHTVLKKYREYEAKLPKPTIRTRSALSLNYVAGRICKELGYERATEHFYALVSSPNTFKKYQRQYDKIMYGN